MKKCLTGFVLLFAGFLLLSGSALGASDWQGVYRELIETREYNAFLRAGNPEYAQMLYDRDPSWDSFTVYDLNQDGTPELLIRIDYAIEQIDVFSCESGQAHWVGTMGGDNFFQSVLCYDRAGIPGRLITLEGGPMMKIAEYQIGNAGLIKRKIGCTRVDWDSEETIGIEMYEYDSSLEALLTASLVSGQDQAEHLIWHGWKDLTSGTGSSWNALFSQERQSGAW